MKVEFHGEVDIDFEFLVGDVNWRDYWGKWVSPKMNNGDWDYWLVIEIINVEGFGWETGCTHIVSLSAVSPEAAGDKRVKKAMASCGPDQVESPDEETIVEALHTYGISALLWQDEGTDPDELLEEAKKQAMAARSLFGFYMDGPKNVLGHTGWDFIRGDLSIQTAVANQKGKWDARHDSEKKL